MRLEEGEYPHPPLFFVSVDSKEVRKRGAVSVGSKGG
jgi:hypothetical protein